MLSYPVPAGAHGHLNDPYRNEGKTTNLGEGPVDAPGPASGGTADTGEDPMRKLSAILVAAAVLATSLVVASPAQAAGRYGYKDGVHLFLNASPEPVKKCGRVTLAAEVYDPSVRDHTGFHVSFLFKRAGSSRYVEKKMKDTAFNGRATAFARQCHPGHWKAVVWVGDWTGPSASDYVKVR